MFWIALVLCLINPLFMAVVGGIFWRRCPVKINQMVGYRTTRSMKNEKTWKFANEYCGKLWFIFGLCLLPVSVGPLIPVYHENILTTGLVGGAIIVVQGIALIVTILLTERALKLAFPEKTPVKRVDVKPASRPEKPATKPEKPATKPVNVTAKPTEPVEETPAETVEEAPAEEAETPEKEESPETNS